MEISATTKGLIKGTFIFAAAAAVLGSALILIVFSPAYIVGYLAGMAIGLLCALLKVLHLERSAAKIMELGADGVKSAKNTMRVGYLTRFMITAAAMLGAALLLGLEGLLGAFLGLWCQTFAAYFIKLFEKKD